MIGNFVNPLPLRTRLADCRSVSELFARVAGTVRDAQAHSGLPYPRLVAELRAARRAREAEFHAWFVLQNTPMPTLDLPHLEVEPVLGDELDVRHDLNLGFWHDGGGLTGGIEYRSELYTQRTVRDLADDYLELARAVAEAPGADLRAVVARLDELAETRRRERHRAVRQRGLEKLHRSRRRQVRRVDESMSN
jgi:non-ribosomal peptide synthetase component F